MRDARIFFQSVRSVLGRVFIRSALYITALLFAFAGLSGYVYHQAQSERADQQFLQMAGSHANMLATLGAGAIGNSDHREVRRLADAMRHELNVTGVDVFDANGTTFLDELARPPISSASVREVLRTGREIIQKRGIRLALYSPVVNSGRVDGVIFLAMRQEQAAAANAALLRQTLLTTGLFVLVSLPLCAYLLHRSTRGISRVTQAANEAAQGFLDTSLTPQGTGEVRELQVAFSTMAQRLRATIQRIEYMANVDHVTCLPNRLKFGNILTKRIDQEKGASGGLFLIDLDRFKAINDMHGHEVGDRLLLLVAERLSALTQKMVDDGLETTPVLSRWSGDEFMILIPGVTDQDVLHVLAEEILRGLRQPFRVDNHLFKVRASIGVCIYPDQAATSDDILRCADMAMFSAKQSGRDRCSFFNVQIRKAAEERERIEHHLRDALAQNEFSVVYQPKVHMTTGRIIGSEALLRWNNPELGQVSPFRFVPLAEECGLMPAIGEFVLQRSLSDMRDMRRSGHDLTIAINVSPVQFQADFFTDRTLGVLGESNFPLERVELEITESALGASPQQIRQQMMPLKDEGVSFAIDDFGTGFSNLGTLTSLPFDTLKIDRSFVTRIDEDEERRNLVQVILLMARQLNMKTVAEGIETEMERRYLGTWGANIGQGYLWSPPVSLAAFRELVEQETVFDMSGTMQSRTSAHL